MRQRILLPATVEPGRHGRRPVRDQGLRRARRPGLGVFGGRSQRQRAPGGAQRPGAFRRCRGAGHRDGRAAVPGRGGASVDREDLQLRRAPRLPRRAGRLHRDGVRGREVTQGRQPGEASGCRSHRLHARDPARTGLSALNRVVLQRPQAGQHHGDRGAAQADRPRSGVTDQLLRLPLWHTRISGPGDRAHRPDRRDRYLYGGAHARGDDPESADPQRPLRRRPARRRPDPAPVRLLRPVAAPGDRSRPAAQIWQCRGDVVAVARRPARGGRRGHRCGPARLVHGIHQDPCHVRRGTACRTYRCLS